MKVSLNKLIQMTVLGLFVGLFLLSGNTVFQLNHIKSDSIEAQRVTSATQAALDARYHIVQIQQFLTDASLMKDSEGVKDGKENLEGAIKNFDKIVELFPEKKATVEELKKSTTNLFNVGEEMFHAYLEKGPEAGNLIMKRPKDGLDATSEETANNVNNLVEEFNKNLSASMEKLNSTEFTATYSIIAFSICIILMVSFGFFVLYKKVKPISFLAEQLENKSKELESAAQNVVGISNNLTDSTTKESSAIDQSAAAMEEISSMLKKTEDGTKHLDSVSKRNLQKAEEGKHSFDLIVSEIEQLKSVIEKITSEVSRGNQEISGIMNLVSDIGQKTKVINDIVFQTKLLSFNASVEAARAGEHGKGFAVVADEMGQLATMSGTAAGEISKLLQSSLSEIDVIIKSTTQRLDELVRLSKSSLDSSFDKLNLGSNSISTILKNSDELATLINDIFLAIQEQNRGVIEINSAINQLQSSSKEVMNSSEKSTAIANSLLQESGEINQISDDLKIVVYGEMK